MIDAVIIKATASNPSSPLCDMSIRICQTEATHAAWNVAATCVAATKSYVGVGTSSADPGIWE